MKKMLVNLVLLVLPVAAYAAGPELTAAGGQPGRPVPQHNRMHPFSAADQISNCSTPECKKQMADTMPLVEELHVARMTVLRELSKEHPSESVIEKADKKSQEIQKKLFDLHRGQLGSMPPRPNGAPPAGMPPR